MSNINAIVKTKLEYEDTMEVSRKDIERVKNNPLTPAKLKDNLGNI